MELLITAGLWLMVIPWRPHFQALARVIGQHELVVEAMWMALVVAVVFGLASQLNQDT